MTKKDILYCRSLLIERRTLKDTILNLKIIAIQVRKIKSRQK